jgi:hypothetical protein
MLLDKSTISNINVSELLKDIDDIINILTKIVKTSMEK